jgi:hypothetical protein
MDVSAVSGSPIVLWLKKKKKKKPKPLALGLELKNEFPWAKKIC